MTSNIAITTEGGGSGGAPGGIGGGGSSSGSGGLGGGGGGGGPCGACKFLRRKCVVGCIFAPYFDSEQGTSHFAAVHKVFGASNVSKMLQHVPVHKRLDAVVTICYEAQARLRNPVYGCVAHIFALQQQVVNLQGEIAYLQAHLANLELQPPSPAPAQVPHFSVSDLPTASSTMPTTYDLSSLIFDPVMQWPQPMLHHHNHPTSDNIINNAGRDDQYVTLAAIPQPSDHHHNRGGGASSSGGRVGVHQGLSNDHHQFLVRHGSSSASAPSTGGTMHGSCSDTQRPGSQPK